MAGQSIARRVVVIVAALLLGVSLVILTMNSMTTTSPQSTTTSTTTTTSPPSTMTTTTTSVTTTSMGSITFSSPARDTELMPDQSYNISGTITPAPTHPDNVLIQVTPQGSLIPLVAETVPVQSNGTFSYSTLIGYTWEMTGTISAPYVITATDTNGATGIETFLVMLPACSPVHL